MNLFLKINLNIISGNGSLFKINQEIKKKNYKNVVVICDYNLRRNRYIQKHIKNFKKYYYLLKHEPTYQLLDREIIKLKKNKKIDCIIAIGGGSIIDFTKGLATLYNNKGKSINYMGFPKNLKKSIPLIAIPSTPSTGTEVTYNAVFINELTNTKLGINTENNYPVLSILDPKLIKLAPKKIVYQSAIASLMRATETFVAPSSNFVTKIFSIKSFELIYNSLKKITKQKDTYKVYSELQWGCLFSMLALSNSGSGPSGVINYYLSANHKVSQALAYSFTSFEFFKHNIRNGYFNYSNLLTDLKIKNNKEKCKYLIKQINIFCKLISPAVLEAKKIINLDKEINKKLFYSFEKNSFVALKNNPIKIGKKKLKNIINKITNI